MLGDNEAVATIAVTDLSAAREFYVGKLGLKPTGEGEPSVITLESGRSKIFVYESRFAGTNRATAATFTVGDDLDSIVGDLRGKGIAFERYPMPNMRLEGDVHVSGKMRVAWFKDPEGNIISLVNS